MKKILLLIVFVSLLSCKSDDDNAKEISLNSQWTLITYTPSAILPAFITYEPGEVVWDFDTQANTINVMLTNGDVILEPGIYNYELIDHTCNYGTNKFLRIVEGEQELGVLILDELQNGSIAISYVCGDGHLAVFEQLLTEN